MQIGTKISGAAHIGLIGLALFGGAFRSEPLPFEVQEVSVISAEEFAALSGQSRVPDVAGEAETPPAPEPEPEPERPVARPDPEPEPAPAPEPTPVPEPEPAPEPVAEPEPATTVVVDPTPPAPQPEPDPVPEPVPLTSTPRPKLRPVDRVAPTPIAPPPPEATPAPETTPAVTPDETAETSEREQEPTAPEEANDRTVTEADEVSETATLAPTRTARPPVRPKRPERPARSNSEDAVNAALAEALAGGDDAPAESAAQTTAPAGPPLTGGEREALRVAVSQCWNLGTSSSAAAATTVVVGVEMTKDAKPIVSTIRMLSYDGGDANAARHAFDAARRAIILCGSKGYDLPAEKYDHWREIEMTFNPERMGQR